MMNLLCFGDFIMAPIIYYIMFNVKTPKYDFAAEIPSPWKQVWGLTILFSPFIVNKFNLNIRY